MDLRDKDGAPLVKWSDPQGAWKAFTRVTRDRPCDQTALTYDKLRDGPGIQWPCTDEAPEGTERLYTDHVFATHPDYCESYGHDLTTGADNEADEYRAHDPEGRAILKAAHYLPPHEATSDEFPLRLTTGRTVYHFHTRTKTARAAELDLAAPDMWVELNAADARPLGIADGARVRVTSPRGHIDVVARLGDVRPGLVFAPFHYGYFELGADAPRRAPRAANELTPTEWDPVSKQPVLKVAAVRVEKVAEGPDTGSAPSPMSRPQPRTGEPEPTSSGAVPS